MEKTTPGIKAQELNRYEIDHLYHSWSFQPDKAPLRVTGAKGCRFYTEDGRERLDFSSCFVSHNIGHQDQRVLDAINDQASKLTSFAPSMSNEPRALLAKKLADITPGNLSRSFLSLGGTEANEAAVKIAHQYTGKHTIISRYQSYHGGTAASMTLSAGDPRNWAQHQGGTNTIRIPQPYCYRCPFGLTYPSCDLQCATHLENVLEYEGSSETVAAMIFEPITGANGIIVPPDDYFPEIEKICKKHGILMIADEVMTGFGRTGKLFAVNHWDLEPDIMTMAKGLTSGYMPLGATITTDSIGNYFKDHFFSHGATYAGHALSCATALRVLSIYDEDNLVENSARLGGYLFERAQELMAKHPSVGNVRGLGLFVGLELVKNKTTKEPMAPINAKLVKKDNGKAALARKLGELGMMVMAANPSSVIGLAPPLIATKDDIDEGIAILDKALETADNYCEKE